MWTGTEPIVVGGRTTDGKGPAAPPRAPAVGRCAAVAGLRLRALLRLRARRLRGAYQDAYLLDLAALSLSGCGLRDGLLRIDLAAVVAPPLSRAPRRVVAWCLLLDGVGFAALWLAELLSALPDGQPTGNLVHDLPARPTCSTSPGASRFLGTARLLRRGRPAGPVLAGVEPVWLGSARR